MPLSSLLKLTVYQFGARGAAETQRKSIMAAKQHNNPEDISVCVCICMQFLALKTHPDSWEIPQPGYNEKGDKESVSGSRFFLLCTIWKRRGEILNLYKSTDESKVKKHNKGKASEEGEVDVV
ncbi:uncharacterized [Tachysurus ichikawai]